MSGKPSRNLPKRLRIDFQSIKPHYAWSDCKGATRKDLLAAGFTEAEADGAVWNSYSNKPMRTTLIIPEEWFWIDRSWWKENKGSSWLEKCYELAGGSFCSLSLEDQAAMFDTPIIPIQAQKGPGNTWFYPDGRSGDMVRVLRSQLSSDGWDMAPAYPPSLDLFVKVIADRDMGWLMGFGDREKDREISLAALETAFADVLAVWDRDPLYFLSILNGFRQIKDIDRDFIADMIRIGGLAFHRSMLSIFYNNRTHINLMKPPNLPPLFGVKNGKLCFFWVTYRSSLRSDFSGYMRDYARPLGLDVTIVRMTKT